MRPVSLGLVIDILRLYLERKLNQSLMIIRQAAGGVEL
jgi:hypothetical protein